MARTHSIEKIDTFSVLYPVVGRFKFFEGPRGQLTGRPAVVIRITAEDGTVGWGQSAPSQKWSYETLESVRTTIDRYLAPELIGRDPQNLKEIHQVMNAAIASSFSIGQPICKSGIDLALHDLSGKLLDQPVTGLWGRTGRQRIPLSWTVNPRSLEEAEAQVAQGLERGYQHFNVKIAPDPTFDFDLCRLVKRMAPEGFLWADANGGYDPPTAMAVAPRLAGIGVAVLEQPLPANRLRGYRDLKRQGALPIIMDEGVVSVVELEEFIALNLLDGVAMKPARCGGLHEARRQIELLQQRGLWFLGSGLTDPDICLAATLALYGAYNLDYPAALNGPQFLGDSLLHNPARVENGEVAVPSGVGLGVQIDEAKLKRLTTRE